MNEIKTTLPSFQCTKAQCCARITKIPSYFCNFTKGTLKLFHNRNICSLLLILRNGSKAYFLSTLLTRLFPKKYV